MFCIGRQIYKAITFFKTSTIKIWAEINLQRIINICGWCSGGGNSCHIMTKATALIIRTRPCLYPVLARLRTPLRRTIDCLEFFPAMGKLALFSIRAVPPCTHVRCAEFCFIEFSVGAWATILLSRSRVSVRAAIYTVRVALIASRGTIWGSTRRGNPGTTGTRKLCGGRYSTNRCRRYRFQSWGVPEVAVLRLKDWRTCLSRKPGSTWARAPNAGRELGDRGTRLVCR